jgi:hypothetical protein
MTDHASPRRSFITSLGAAAVAAAGVGVGAAEAQSTTPRAASAFKAARHADDDWMDKLPGKHRMVIDAVTPHGAGEAILFANNLYEANKAAYGLPNQDLAIIVVMRHFATPFAFTDTVWAKYGKPMGGMLEFMDPKTKEAPTTNLYNSAAYGLALPNLGTTIDSVLKRGTQFAVCDVATKFASGQLAAGGLGDAKAIYSEMTSNMYPGSRIVPAGVVAVSRAQERGYTLIYAG